LTTRYRRPWIILWPTNNIVDPNKKPLSGLFYFAAGFRGARGFGGALGLGSVGAAAFFSTCCFLAGARGLAAGAALTSSTGAGLDSTTGAGVSILYGVASGDCTGAFPNKNSLIFVNIMFSYAIIY
jgi:hypothetical protein